MSEEAADGEDSQVNYPTLVKAIVSHTQSISGDSRIGRSAGTRSVRHDPLPDDPEQDGIGDEIQTC